MTVESRASWGARTAKSPTYLASTRGVKAHYTGGSVNVGTLTDHDKCRSAVRGIQNGHMDGNGWNDIGYSMIACEHAAMIGRGAHVLPAANGSGLNSGHYAILVLVGTSGSATITDNMKIHFHEARDFLRNHGSAGKEIKRHKDGYATDCPGASVSNWVLNGAKKPGNVTPTPPPDPEPEGDDVPQYFSYGRSDENPISVPAGDGWTKITWDTEYSDPGNEHTGSGYTMLLGDPSLYNFAGFVEWDPAAAGAVIEHRVSEYRYDAGPPAVDNLEEAGFAGAAILGPALTSSFHEIGSVAEGRKLVFEVRHNAPGALGIKAARAKLTAWQ